MEARYKAADETIAKNHFYAVRLLALGRSVGEVAELPPLSTRRASALIERRNEGGTERPGDQRGNDGTEPTIPAPQAPSALHRRPNADEMNPSTADGATRPPAAVRPPQNKKYLCAIGSRSAGSHTSSAPSAVTA